MQSRFSSLTPRFWPNPLRQAICGMFRLDAFNCFKLKQLSSERSPVIAGNYMKVQGLYRQLGEERENNASQGV